MTLNSVGPYFGIVGAANFARLVGWLAYSIYIGIRGERIATKTGALDHIPVTRDIKVKDINSTGSNIKDEEGCVPDLGKGKLRPESAVLGGMETHVPGMETIWGYLPQSDGSTMFLGTDYRATQASSEVWKGERWQLASL